LQEIRGRIPLPRGVRLRAIAHAVQMDNDTRGLPNFDIQAAEQSLRLIDRTLIGSKINYKRINLLMTGVKSVIRDRRAPPSAELRYDAKHRPRQMTERLRRLVEFKIIRPAMFYEIQDKCRASHRRTLTDGLASEPDKAHSYARGDHDSHR
jgi:hypothetical protein